LRQVAETVFPVAANVRAIAINQADAAILARHFPRQVAWMPNPATEVSPPPLKAVARAQRWLHQQMGQKGPVWLMPCRLVRRKNIAEALLLTRWLRSDAYLVTTGGVSSSDEEIYATRLADAARKHDWPIRLGVLQSDEPLKPTVPQLMAASEVILLTSLQEGFGLTYVEAASSARPLIARQLLNMVPDLAKFRLRFPQSYQEVLVVPVLFNWAREQERQRVLFDRWRGELPLACRRFAARSPLLALAPPSEPVPFSRLTLTAQLEILACPAAESWALCAPLNPHLQRWRTLAEAGKLSATPWSKSASTWLAGPAYGRRFRQLLRSTPSRPVDARAAIRAQEEFIRSKLVVENLYPLLWSTQT
jgi:hypothetical protein